MKSQLFEKPYGEYRKMQYIINRILLEEQHYHAELQDYNSFHVSVYIIWTRKAVIYTVPCGEVRYPCGRHVSDKSTSRHSTLIMKLHFT